MPEKQNTHYQIKISLKDWRPPIWRRILLPGSTSLLKLHDVIQILMAWWDYHLHMFTIGRVVYGDPADDEEGYWGTLDESLYTLDDVICAEGQRFSYLYDFGDSWDLALVVEKILEPAKRLRQPVCLQGKRAAPPEDVGGIGGYENFLQAIRDPEHDEHDEYLIWIGGKFDPEAFDLESVNAELKEMGRGRSTESRSEWFFDEKLNSGVGPEGAEWLDRLPEDQRAAAESLPLCRDVAALLAYLRDHRVTGTQSTGNFPLKAVREICAEFVNPPRMETSIGSMIYPVRSESEVPSLYFCHLLAVSGGWISGGMGRRWKLTPLGQQYLQAPALLQWWMLCVSWWMHANWTHLSHWDFQGGYMPFGFASDTQQCLLELETGKPTPFEAFADRWVERSRLVGPFQDEEQSRWAQRAIVEDVVVDPLASLGILQCEYEPHATLGEEFPVLQACQVTPLGRSLLEALQVILSKDRYR